MNKNWDKMDKKLGKLEKKLGALDKKLDALEKSWVHWKKMGPLEEKKSGCTSRQLAIVRVLLSILLPNRGLSEIKMHLDKIKYNFAAVPKLQIEIKNVYLYI